MKPFSSDIGGLLFKVYLGLTALCMGSFLSTFLAFVLDLRGGWILWYLGLTAAIGLAIFVVVLAIWCVGRFAARAGSRLVKT